MCVWVRALTTLLSWEDGTLRPSVRLGPPPPLCPAGRAGPARWPTAPASVGWANQSPTRGGGGGPCGEVVAVLGEGEGVDRALPARQHAAPQPRRVPGSVRAATAGPATGVGGCRRSRRRPRTRHGTADGGGGGGAWWAGKVTTLCWDLMSHTRTRLSAVPVPRISPSGWNCASLPPRPRHTPCRLGAVSRAGVAPARTRLGSSLGGPRHRGRTCAKAPLAPTPTIAAPGAGPADTRATGASRALGRASY